MSNAGKINIIVCGVGGQGILKISNAIGEACARSGRRVISGEMHGLAQRSGSVIVHQRIGEKVLSPLIPYGEADVILSLELIESLRYLYFLKPGGTVITSGRQVNPPGESHFLVGKKIEKYCTREDITEAIRNSGTGLVEIDAAALAEEAGSHLTENTVMLGALSAFADFPLGKDTMIEAVKMVVPAKAVDMNKRAFELGFKKMKGTKVL